MYGLPCVPHRAHPENLEVPNESWIQTSFHPRRSICYLMPAEKIEPSAWQVLFSILWLSFVCYWTIAAVSSGVLSRISEI